jgi:pimeloyl-ACP methyl ester carboxylesterase
MKFRNIAALLALSTTLSACVSGDDSTPADSNPNAGFQARYAPLGGQMPFPNDLFSGKSGQLAIPGDTTVAQNGPLLALNHLDGFGTQSDISIYFTQPVDKTTITANIFVLKVTSNPKNKAVDGFTKVLTPGTDYSIQLSPGIDSNGQIVTIKPLHPLAPSTVDPVTHLPTFSTYMVIVTRGVKDASGANVSPSADFSTIVAADTPAIGATGADVTKIDMAANDPLLPVAQFDLGQLAVAAGAGAKLDTIAVTFSFSTQFLKVALAEVAANAAPTAQPAGVGIVDTTLTVCDALFNAHLLPDNVPAHCEVAVPGSSVTEVFAGTVALPYYLTVPAKGSKDALTDSWHNANGGDIAASTTDPTSFVPKATVAQNVIPILVAMPLACGAAPAGGWPVTIFQHGITRSREDMLPIASALSVGGAAGGLCTAVLAIDLPLHGVTNTADPLYVAGHERTFDMDATGAAGAAAAAIGGSGAQFINLNSTITSRDNLREGAADLINLVASLSNIKPGGVTLDHTKVFFVGHSLGAIIGTTFLGADSDAASLTASAPKVIAGVVAMPGGHIAELLRNSPTFGPVIDDGLEKQGLVKGSQSYYDFFSEAQSVVEDGDPANYAADAAAGHLMHMIEVVGGKDKFSPPDQVVPNSATDVLIGQMGITTTITASAALTAGHPTLAQFISGDHGSILDPTAPDPSVAAEFGGVTGEMQSEAATVVFNTLGGAPGVSVNAAAVPLLSATLKQ